MHSQLFFNSSLLAIMKDNLFTGEKKKYSKKPDFWWLNALCTRCVSAKPPAFLYWKILSNLPGPNDSRPFLPQEIGHTQIRLQGLEWCSEEKSTNQGWKESRDKPRDVPERGGVLHSVHSVLYNFWVSKFSAIV